MRIFLDVVGGMLLSIFGILGIVIPIGYYTSEDPHLKTGIFITVFGFLLSAVCLTLGLLWLSTNDNSRHCGPDTVYQESSRLVGKIIETDWWCAVK